MRNVIRICCIMVMAAMLLPAVCFAEATAVPTVSITAPLLTDWEGKHDVREAKLTYSDPLTGISFTCPITIKPQGTSSLGYDKKNFTIVMQDEGREMQPGWGIQTEYCLKANYIDPTHAGNVVSAKLVGQMNEATGKFDGLPNRGAIDGFPVWVVLNGEDVGLYCWNIPKSAWMFGMDESNPDHIVMCCEGWTESSMFLTDCFVPEEEWSVYAGPYNSNTIGKFDRVMDFICNSTDEEFVRDFDKYLDLDACMNYYCFMCISLAYDNTGKNMLMVTWDGQVWHPMLYDLDSLWGIDCEGKGVWEGIDPLSVVYNGNRLFERIRQLYYPELCERYAMLREGPLSNENIWRCFYEYADMIPEELLEWDEAYWHPEGDYIRDYSLMQTQMDIYLPIIDAEFGYYAE